ncbi:MAG: D-aminoacyl-tRNA deacylase [Muribaculaceae bacterium]
MKIVIQRVSTASVAIDNEIYSGIKQGLLILVGVGHNDTREDAEYLAAKAANMRIFDDENGVMNRSVIDIDGVILAVSQFTLMASTKKGNRPSYIHAAGHDLAIPMYDLFCELLEKHTGKPTQKGVFGADMKVILVNDGPVTIVMDSKNRE